MKNILIVDAHPITRSAIRSLAETQAMSVVGEGDDGLQAIILVRQLHPDLLIIDIDIPSLNGIDVVQRIRHRGFERGVLIFSGKDSEHYVRRSASAGADGFISKCKDLSELTDAMRAICSGYGYFPVQRARSEVLTDNQLFDQDKIDRLSLRELEILRYLVQGMKVIEVAKIMRLSDKTVSTYKSRMMTKLELKNMIDVFDFAQRHNLD